MIYSFDNTPLPLVQSAIIPLSSRVASVDTPAHSGAYVGIRRTAARMATIIGTLKSSSFEQLKSDWADLQAAHHVHTPRQLVVREGWFYLATPESLTESEVETSNLHYQADYRLGDPYAYSSTLSTATLATNGSTTVNVGGTVAALPTISVVVTTAPAGGSVLIWNLTNGEKAILYPGAAQQYRINSRTEKMELGLASEFSGQFISLKTGANDISISAHDGATLASAAIEWRNRSL